MDPSRQHTQGQRLQLGGNPPPQTFSSAPPQARSSFHQAPQHAATQKHLPQSSRPPSQQHPHRAPNQQIPIHTYPQGVSRASSTGSQGIPRKSTIPSLSHVPRKSHSQSPQLQQLQQQQLLQPHAPSRISLKSEHPFIIKVKVSGVPLDRGGVPRKRAKAVAEDDEDDHSRSPGGRRSSSRTPKKARRAFSEDLEDTDSDASEAAAAVAPSPPFAPPASKKRIKKKAERRDYAKPEEVDDLLDGEDAVLPVGDAGGGGGGAVGSDAMAGGLDANNVEAPPPGVLASLWYSRECVLHVFVIEKILGWKTRPVVRLQYSPEKAKSYEAAHPKAKHPGLPDPDKAAKLRDAVVTDYITDSRKRMEVSRINPSHCPFVMKVASTRSEQRAKKKGLAVDFVARTSETEREEVLLIKWRGRSHLHCSWERRRDLEKLDPTNTAKGKIRRYMQSQEASLGKNWRAVLDEGRSEVHQQIHAHGSQAKIEAEEDKNAPTEEEDFFPPDYTEVERILACDENEMDMNVFAKQRALNLKAETEALQRMEQNGKAVSVPGMVLGKGRSALSEKTSDASHSTSTAAGSTANVDVIDDETGWDPEDYVRYVVKWKGLQFADVTWEYWKDIKNDFVDQVEDFWYRQRTPSAEEVKAIASKPHPHVRDFKKLSESPLFGASTVKRPIADLGGTKPQNDTDDDVEPPALRLRGYQLEGVNWLLWNWWNRRSCILADEMGLGKTIQSVCFLDQVNRLGATKVRGPFLVVAPLSLVNQWQSESTTWAPDMNVILYHGSADARNFLVKQEFYYSDLFVAKATAAKLKRQHMTKFHILITTYEVVLKDVAVLSKIRWKALIVDEAHRLKNAKSRLFEELASVPRDFCLLLTGTPLQNSTEELWALLHFADPVTFGSKEAFVEKFGQLTDAQQVSDLHSVLRPYLLRRVKEDVEKSLPPKEETILEVTLTPIQKAFYKAIYEKNTAFLFKGAKPSNAPSLMNVMMELRKCCNHPFLIRGAEERILADAAAAADKAGEKPAESGEGAEYDDLSVDWQALTAEHLVNSSGKMVLLTKLLPKLQAGGHKVLIFSQMVRVLDLLEDLLRMKRYKYERLDGSKSASSRAGAVDRFNRKSCQRFVMLLSTRAGGLGLNLTSADTVVIFDSDWNPQNDLQAMARAHRIGQTRAVRVYRLLTAKTYEMHMFHSASLKLGLDRAVLAHQRQSTEEDDSSSSKKKKSKSEKEMQAKEIDELLKKGAYDVFRDDDDNEAQQFMETDIDQLLERSSRKVTYGTTATTSLSSGLGSFSKASFVASTGDGDGKDVDLDDPDFWEKAVGLDVPPESTGDEEANLLFEKRSRKQVQVYDPYAEYAEAEKKKKDKIAQKMKQEREEKERIRLEKKQKKEEERERKKRERDEQQRQKEVEKKKKKLALIEKEKEKEKEREKKLVEKEKEKKEKPPKKKLKKAERKRAARRAEREDPVLERIKQAWEIPQRNRATAAALRFGFGRLCKIRHESNLTSLPIQDIELFVRAFCYQLGAQAAVCLMKQLCNKNGETPNDHGGDLASFLMRAVGDVYRASECEFIARAIDSALKLNNEIQSERRTLRIPLTLTENSYVSELRSGGSIRALRRFAFLSRLNSVIEASIDSILADLGHEELGKRGCSIKDLSTLDVDLKSRHVSTEELSHALGMRLHDMSQGDGAFPSLAPWWDRSCDLALIVGTFIHGLGNYEAMRNDEELPFGRKIAQFAVANPASARAFRNFTVASKAARKVFDDALTFAKSKAQVEAHEAVAAVLAASKMNKQNDAAVKESEKESHSSSNQAGATIADDCGSGDKTHNGTSAPKSTGSTNAKQRDDSEKITLHKLSAAVGNAIELSSASKLAYDPSVLFSNKTAGNSGSPLHQSLPMPSAQNLDHLLSKLVDTLMAEDCGKAVIDAPRSCVASNQNGLAQFIDTIKTNEMLAGKVYSICGSKSSLGDSSFQGRKCGSHHRSLADGSDYDLSAASADLAAITSGADASRYQREKYVPLLITRYGLGSLVYADRSILDTLVEDDELAEKSSGKECVVEGDGTASNVSTEPLQIKSSKLPADEQAMEEHVSDAISGSKLSGILRHIPGELLLSPGKRASLCAALLCYGLPVSSKRKPWRQVQDGVFGNAAVMSGLFSMSTIMVSINEFSGSSTNLTEIEVKTYYDRALIPYCVHLCLQEPGKPREKSKSSAKGNESMVLWETCKPGRSGLKTPLPDPCIPMKYHSEESIANAFAILRRIRLSRAVQYVIGGGVSRKRLISFLQSSLVRGDMDGIPSWWCPWIHDLAVLIHAASFGLFAIIHDHKDQSKMQALGSVFERGTVENYVKAVFIEGMEGRPPALPQCFLKKSTPTQLEKWVKVQALQFPTAYVLERRIALICTEMTKEAASGENENSDFSCKYQNIPMFDHGGWPLNDQRGVVG